MRERRRTLKITADQLSKRTRELGYPISRVAVGKIENGQREGKLDLAELVVLAAALGIPPVMLLYPGLPHGPVEALPGLELESKQALEWFAGDTPQVAFRVTEKFGMSQQDVVDAAEPLLLTRELLDAEREVMRVSRLMAQLDADEAATKADARLDGEFGKTLKSAINASEKSRVDTLRRMRAMGLPVREGDDR